MGIRFEHQAGAGLIGAYAAGQAQGRRRRQDQALDILQQQQNQRNRLSAMRYRNLMGGGGQQAGVWTDPFLGENNERLEGQEFVQRRAQLERNARAQRMGKPLPYPDAMPQFVSQDQIEDQREAAAEEKQRKRAAEEQRKAEQRKASQAWRKSEGDRLRASIQHLSPEQRRELEGDLAGIVKLLTDGQSIDWTNPGQAAVANRKIEEFEARVAGMPKRDPNKGWIFDNGRLRETQPGETATHDENFNELPWFTAQREREGTEAEKKTAADEKRIAADEKKRSREDAQRDKLQTRIDRLVERRRTIQEQEGVQEAELTVGQKKVLQELASEIAQLTQQMNRIGAPASSLERIGENSEYGGSYLVPPEQIANQQPGEPAPVQPGAPPQPAAPSQPAPTGATGAPQPVGPAQPEPQQPAGIAQPGTVGGFTAPQQPADSTQPDMRYQVYIDPRYRHLWPQDPRFGPIGQTGVAPTDPTGAILEDIDHRAGIRAGIAQQAPGSALQQAEQAPAEPPQRATSGTTSTHAHYKRGGKDQKPGFHNRRTHENRYGSPVAKQPAGPAAQKLIAKGYEYVNLLDDKGNETGRRAWRPPQGEFQPVARQEQNRPTQIWGDDGNLTPEAAAASASAGVSPSQPSEVASVAPTLTTPQPGAPPTMVLSAPGEQDQPAPSGAPTSSVPPTKRVTGQPEGTQVASGAPTTNTTPTRHIPAGQPGSVTFRNNIKTMLRAMKAQYGSIDKMTPEARNRWLHLARLGGFLPQDKAADDANALLP